MIAPVHVQETEPGVGSVVVDGQELSGIVSGFTITCVGGKMSRLTLDLVTYPVSYAAECDVALNDSVRDALIALGWTPPVQS